MSEATTTDQPPTPAGLGQRPDRQADLGQRGDGRRHRALPGDGVLPAHPAGVPVRQRHPPGRHVHPGQHGAQQHVHPAGRRRAQHRPGAADRPGDPKRRRPRRGLHQPDHDRRPAGPRRDHPAAHPGRAGDHSALLRRRVEGPRPRRAVRLDDHARLLLHAAGVLLRRVRAGRPGAQRPGQVRSDDVGADRQQRDLDHRAAVVLGRLRPHRHRGGLHPRSGDCCSASAPRWASRSRRRC